MKSYLTARYAVSGLAQTQIAEQLAPKWAAVLLRIALRLLAELGRMGR